jgi:hypothetical protein
MDRKAERKRAADGDVEAVRNLLREVASDVRSVTSGMQCLVRSLPASLVERGEWAECPQLFDREACQCLQTLNLALMRSSLNMFNRLEEGLHYASPDILDDVLDAQGACRAALGTIRAMPVLVQGMVECLDLIAENVSRLQSVVGVLHEEIHEMLPGDAARRRITRG